MESKIYLTDLISLGSFGKSVKLIRHYDSRINLNNDLGGFEELVKFGLLDEYQSYQKNDIFNCDFIISFYGEENSKAVFYGIYKVIQKGQNAPIPSSNFRNYWDEMEINDQTYFYELEELEDYKKFKNRIVIKWGDGSSTRSWHQWISEEKRKEVIEIRPENFIGEFPGWKNVIIDFFDLKKMISNPDSHRNWFNELSKISAVYAILDKSCGNIYIGSAYNEKEGLWSRWLNYSKDPTGGNKLLQELKKKNNDFYKYLQFSILEILPKGARKEDVLKLEKTLKDKLGTKVYGLNAN